MTQVTHVHRRFTVDSNLVQYMNHPPNPNTAAEPTSAPIVDGAGIGRSRRNALTTGAFKAADDMTGSEDFA